ncbi:phosphotransferase [Phormidium tenue FACHB-886]|nr:phosphotransferase [Phormidium tenue FACHB-886]
MDFNYLLKDWLTDVYGFTITPKLELFQRPTSIQIIRIIVGNQTYWLRLYIENYSSLKQIGDEASALEQLYQNGVKVARPIHRKDGKFVGGFGDYLAIMFAHADGIEVKAPTTEQAAAFGSLVARIHAFGSALTLPNRPLIDYRFLGEQPLKHVEPYLAERRTEFEELRRIAKHTRDQVWKGGKDTELPNGFCHGDVHLENVKFAGTSPTIFDFEACAIGPYVYDVACYWRKLILANRNKSIYEKEWEAFLHGYQAVRSLQHDELKAVPALATLRAIWVMALPAQPGVTWGTDWLTDLSYFDAHFKMIQDFARHTHSKRF